MINQFLCFLAQMLPAYFHVVALEQMTIPEERKTKKIVRYLVWNIYIGMGNAIRIIVNDQARSQTFALVYGMLGFLIFQCIFYKGKLWKKIVITVAVTLGTFMAEILLVVCVSQLGIQSMLNWDFRNTQIMLFTMFGAFLSSLGIWLVTLVWKRVILSIRMPKYAFYFLIYAVILMIPFTNIKYLLLDGIVNPPVYYSMLTAIVCGITLAFVVFYEIQKNTLQEEYTETNEKRELEAIHFEDVLRHRTELETITEENDKTMQEIEDMLVNGQIEEAESTIQTLLKQIELTREYPHSSIPIVNVVLTQKQKECEQNNIILKLDINLQEELNIKQTDICSAFANILDNAIRSCKQMMEHGDIETAKIALKAGMNRNYLIIRCENPYKEELGKFREGSGLGLKILKDIAKRYAGDFKTEQREGMFITQLTLQM